MTKEVLIPFCKTHVTRYPSEVLPTSSHGIGRTQEELGASMLLNGYDLPGSIV